jgi:hypothetical protein
MKRYALFLLILSAACSKSDNPIQMPQSAQLISKVYTYDQDTNTLAYFVDSLEYNSQNQVIKIDVYTSPKDTLAYTFSYNSDGTITQMHVRDRKYPIENNDYYLSYRNDKKLDSIRQINSVESFITVFKYNAQQLMTEVSTFTNTVSPSNLIYRSTYYRSSQIDSINSDNYQSNTRVNRRMNTVPIDAKPVLSLNKTYMLMLAERYSFRSLFLPGLYDPCFTHQFINPDELIIRNGATMEYTLDGHPPVNQFPYSNTFWLNPAGNLRLYRYSYSQGLSPALDVNIYSRFEYITK